MGWNDEETRNVKKGMSTSSKLLVGIIACIMLIIVLIIVLMSVQGTSFEISVNGKTNNTTDRSTLLVTINNVTYINIEEFAKLVGYEYHKGEYKASTIDANKCYVEGTIETATFYSNDNTIYKLLVDKQNEQYQKHKVENTVKLIDNKMFASIEAISKAFNVLISETNNDFKIYTLDYLINLYDSNVKKWGYTGIKDQSFENKKALLHGFLIVKKEGGLYKIIDTNNTKEIVLDRYTKIEFSENTQEFFVTDSSNKVGIVDISGSTKIEPIYDSISVLDKDSNLYIVELEKKYGVASNRGGSIIYPEYDSIGLNDNSIVENKYLLLNELIPVCKDGKWGAFNKTGSLILNVEYDEFGYLLKSIDINGVKEVVQPVIEIERANGIVVKKSDKYGLLDVKGKELVPIAVDGIYAINGAQDDDEKFFMLYNGEELNVIERLIKAGLIQEKVENNQQPENFTNEIVSGNTVITNTTNNTFVNNIN